MDLASTTLLLLLLMSLLHTASAPTHEDLMCLTSEGKNMSEAVLERDKFGCTVCFCPGDPKFPQYDDNNYDLDDSGELPYAICIAVDCAPPRCVNPVREEPKANGLFTGCCYNCTTGENCYFGKKKKNGKRKTIQMGKCVKKGKKICCCDDKDLDLGDTYRKEAICKKRK